ncbi:camp-dependent protein kinase catalytic subunit [Tulasnella sp. 403]|nr:camp-dependent protein kinase catalytic subunit [Tulasnella sp. 403]
MLAKLHLSSPLRQQQPPSSPAPVQIPAMSHSSPSPASSTYDTLSTARSSAGSSFASRGAIPSPSSDQYAQERALSAALKGTYESLPDLSFGQGVQAIKSQVYDTEMANTALVTEMIQVTDNRQPEVQSTLQSRDPLPILRPTPVLPTALPAQSIPTSTRKKARYGLQDFHFHRTLGTGSFGRVHLVQSDHNKRYYAIKVLLKEKVVRLKQVEHTNNEREMLTRVRHPFLVNLWGTFQDAANLYMVMDFVAGGELFSLLRKSGRFPNPVAKFYAAEVSMAIDYLHSINIIYRDLKPENILIGADGHIKVTDFGFAKFVPDLTYTLCGTPDYLAPEVIQQKGYNKSVDWYSVGILIFEMLAGYPPFYIEPGTNSTHVQLYEKIIAGVVHYPQFFDPLAVDIVQNCLTTDLSRRYGNMKYGSKDIFGHPWFAEVGWERIYKKEIPPPFIPRIENDGDSSQFDRYPEADISTYGAPGIDTYADLFAEWS